MVPEFGDEWKKFLKFFSTRMRLIFAPIDLLFASARLHLDQLRIESKGASSKHAVGKLKAAHRGLETHEHNFK
jgi:hypothetical protein